MEDNNIDEYGATRQDENKFDGVSSTATSEEEVTNMSFAAKVYDVFFNVLFLMIHGNNPNPILEYLTFIIEDLQLISFAFSYKLEIHMLPEWIQEVLDILEYHGEDFNYEKYKVVFGLSAFAVVILVLNLAYIFYGCWVSKRIYKIPYFTYIVREVTMSTFGPLDWFDSSLSFYQQYCSFPSLQHFSQLWTVLTAMLNQS